MDNKESELWDSIILSYLIKEDSRFILSSLILVSDCACFFEPQERKKVLVQSRYKKYFIVWSLKKDYSALITLLEQT